MDTIYSLFQKVVKEHENAPAIIENDRAMTFGELSIIGVKADSTSETAGITNDSDTSEEENTDSQETDSTEE